MIIIGLCGEKGSGKDTICDILSKSHNIKRFAFADPLKDSLKSLFLWDDSNFSRENKEEIDNYWGVSPRQMCQVLGTDVIRKTLHDKFDKSIYINQDEYKASFWIKRIHKQLEEYLIDSKGYDCLMFTDIRFLDELDYVKRLGGRVYKVLRAGLEKNEYSQHIAEKGIDDEEFISKLDGTIINNGTIEDLNNEIQFLFK